MTPPVSYAISQAKVLSLFEDGSAFVFENGKLLFDFQFSMDEKLMKITFNDDASWADLKVGKEILEGTLYSYITEPVELSWKFNPITLVEKPEAKTALQAIRFHDRESLSGFESPRWNELLIEAATCGHLQMIELCISQGADANVELSRFESEAKSASMALTKAIQCGHELCVQKLLDVGANIHHHSFDLDRDNFYHACFLYQARPDKGELVLSLLLNAGVDFHDMSAFYLAAVMVTFPEGPLGMAQEDTKMLRPLFESGAHLDDFLLIDALHKDTPLMFAAHMGLYEPLKLLVELGANILESYEGLNALDRALTPLVIDPQMPHQGDEKVIHFLRDLGLHEQSFDSDFASNQEVKSSEKNLDIGSLEDLFKL